MRVLSLLSSAMAIVSCSFTRFGEIQDNAPVVVIDGSNVTSGFGATLSIQRQGGSQRLAASGVPGASGAAEYELGSGQDPTTDAVRTDLCSTGCVNAIHTASVVYPQGTGACFAVGYGEALNGVPAGARLHCSDGKLANLQMPTGFDASAEDAKKLVFGASRDGTLLVASSPSQRRVWSYPAVDQGATPTELSLGGTGPAARSLAVFEGATRFLLAGEPDANKVHVFREDGSYAGCLAGEAGFGKSIAVGTVLEGSYDLAVGTNTQTVRVLHGDKLGTLAGACVDVTQDSSFVIVDLRCRVTADVESCDTSFGDALAIARLDGDADGEVLVGAPAVSVRGENSAGAVFVYDVEPPHLDWQNEAKFVSSANSGDRLGSSLAVLEHDNGFDTFAAGLPGASKAAIFYCPKLAGGRGSRCQ